MVFQVGGTKKGGMPVTTEKRPRGKTVTVIGNVKGDKAELIRLLKSSLGCGGHAIGHDRVEIQGDHASAIQDLLLKHGGSGAMKGVAGLKPPREARRTDEAEKAEETKASLATEKAEAREDARRRRARESRQRSLKEAVLVKPESTRAFHAFCAMMKQWRYWDQDYDKLHEMHHRHVRELDDNSRSANDARLGGTAGAAILDADDSFLDDNERMQSGARSAALETMRSNLDALNREITQSRADPAEGAEKLAYDSLRALGMIAEPSPFRQTREERLAESRRNAAEARARALNEARVSAARRKEKEKENVFRGGAVSTSNAGYASAGGGSGSGGGRFRSSRAGGASVKKHGKGDASRPTLGFTAARKRGGLRGLSDDEDEYDEETRSGSEDDGIASASATARWDSTPGFASRDDGGGFSFGPVAGAGATPAWAVSLEAVGDGGDGVPAESLSREELDLREALRQSLLEAERATRREQVGLHVECGDVWGELSEEEALALAMELSEQDERRRLREERDLYEAYQAGAYGSVDGSEDDFEEARFAYAEETPNDVEFSAARDDADADLAEALRLSALESERERVFARENRARSSLMPETMDEDAALREALRLSALESGAAKGENAVGSGRVSPRGAKETACQWAAAHLGAFTGESDNSVLAEYVVSMSRAEVEEFLGESFGDAEAAEAFARALEEMR
jgi:translation initiation factor 1 (eIF-1/SUI1)